MEPYKPPTCDDECPARGVGLRHAHSQNCKHGHADIYCCDCFGPFRHEDGCRHERTDEEARESAPTTEQPIMDPLDVTARLEALGLMPVRDDNTPVEPRLALGQWVNGSYVPGVLTGPTWGSGRGSLTPRQKDRLLRIDEQQAWLDARS